jgi:acid phosphatase family membrane protein YuiD
MKFLFIPLVVYLLNQIIKYFYVLHRNRKIVGNRLFWTFIWVGQFPSAHSAVLASSLTLVYLENGLNAVFGFCVFAALIFIYGLLEDKKRQMILENYYVSSDNPALVQAVKDEILIDFAGHTLLEVIAGIIVGIILTLYITKII